MIREKRISKPPVPFPLLYPHLIGKSASNGAKKQRRRKKECEYKIIPSPAKFINNYKVFPLYGDIFLTERNNVLSFDPSVLSRFKLFRDIEVTQKMTTRVINISAEPKEANNQDIQWKQLFKKIKTSSAARPELFEQAFLIKDFCTKYENFVKELQQRNNQFAKNEQEEENLRITKDTATKKAQLLEFLPCFAFKIRSQNSEIRLTEIIFNELLVKCLGYSIDSFVTLVFEEGVPQFTSHDSEAILDLTKTLLGNFFAVGPEGIVTPETSLLLQMKNKYVRNAQAQTHFLMNYEENCFGIDIILTIQPEGEPYMSKEPQPKFINADFIYDMATNEIKTSEFISLYYNKALPLRFNHFENICTIQEVYDTKDEDIDYL